MFNGKIIEIVESYCYLGVLFNSISRSNAFIFREHIIYVTQKASKSLFLIRNVEKKVGKLPIKVSLKLFDTLVKPILEYGSEIWIPLKEANAIERLQLKYLKYILGVKTSTSTLAVLGETGRFKLHLSFKIRTIKYWLRLCKLTDNSLVKRAYNCANSLCHTGYVTWASKVKVFLQEVNLEHLWESEVCSELDVLHAYKTRLYELNIRQWKTAVDNTVANPVLYLYRLYTTNYVMSPYLNLKSYQLRKAICKF
jgi:hypothetical protein